MPGRCWPDYRLHIWPIPGRCWQAGIGLVPARHRADAGMPSFRQTDAGPILARCLAGISPCLDGWCLNDAGHGGAGICRHQLVSARHLNVYRVAISGKQPKCGDTRADGS